MVPPAHRTRGLRGRGAAILELLRDRIEGPLATLLELGSGGGNMASHLTDLMLTLSDLSPEMLELSRTINPGVEHLAGDMRTLRLGRTFDAVLIHDAICYMTTESDLRAAIDTAFVHLRPGGVAVLQPDHVRERSSPAPITVARTPRRTSTGRLAAASAISSGPPIRIPLTRPTRSTTRCCSATTTGAWTCATTATSRGCSRPRRGSS